MKTHFKEIQNKKAFFDFEIVDQYDAGMKLSAEEVKEIAYNKFTLTGNYVKIINQEVYLISDSVDNSIKLLLHKKEINRLLGKVKEQGFTLIPLRIYQVRGKFKVQIALAKGKKEYDKRATEKKRDIDIETKRVVKSQSFGEY